MEHELDVATNAAREAVEVIREVTERARANPTQKDKGQGPVTEADLAADRVLREKIGAAFPDDALVTEETWSVGTPPPADAARVWFCDPLDGTQEFVNGRDDYCVMIGLVVDGVPALGVVAQPTTGTVWRAIVDDARCERIEESGDVTPLDARGRATDGQPRAVVSRSHPSKLTNHVAEAIDGVIVKRGSVGLKIAAIIDDEAEVYLSGSSRMKLWDTAGPAALLAAAGGAITSLRGDALDYRAGMEHKGGLFAAPGTVREALNERVDAALDRWKAKLS
jgi:3'(2'), 5'-bisphosphate nucleotidase